VILDQIGHCARNC